MAHKRAQRTPGVGVGDGGGHEEPRLPRLEVVVKADTGGTLEAVTHAVNGAGGAAAAEISVIGRSVGDVTKSDLAMAATGSRLVLGFDVGLPARAEAFAKEQGVEVRLYEVVDHLARDVAQIARSLVVPPAAEKLLCTARVVALFKSTRRGIILGCEVLEGKMAVGMRFRVIDVAGPIYEGVVGSLHIERDEVRHAVPGQKVGLKIADFKQARVGDLVECYEPARSAARPWSPRPGAVRVTS